MISAPQAQPLPPAEAAAVTKAALRAAGRLAIRNNALARIIGLSEPTVTRMKKGRYLLEPGQKPFELALLFIRLYRSLDAIVGGDEAVAQSWLKNTNTVLGDAPLTLIQSVAGLTNVIQYLDARRGIA